MPRFTAQTTTSTALANGNAVASVVPAATANCKITSITLGVNNAGGAITDFDLSVGLNRGTARGGTPVAVTINKADQLSAPPLILIDGSTTGQPTLAAADGWLFSFNSRGGFVANFNEWDIISEQGTAKPLVFVQRSGAALPASHSITLTVGWLE